MTIKEDLLRKIEDKSAVVAILGLGYVGLPLAHELVRAGYRVLGYDISAKVVDGLMAGRSHIKDISDEQLAAMLKDVKLKADVMRRNGPIRTGSVR